MYTEFYGLHDKPFALLPDPRFLYLGSSHREALAHLLYGIEEGEGFIEIIGQVGTGKTTLCRTLLERVGPDVEIAFIFNPSRSEAELLAAINREFLLPTAARSRGELIEELNRFLLAKKAQGRRVLLVIDEAQNLDAAVLEQVRLLSNLETEHEKLLQIVLIGQPELEETLARSDLRQLRQRITVRWDLQPFDVKETREYLRHRLEVAGFSGKDPFTPSAVRAIHRLSGGIPRLINAIADRSLLNAYSRGAYKIDARTVRRSRRELPSSELGPLPTLGMGVGRSAAAALMLGGVVAGFTATTWIPLEAAVENRSARAATALPPVASPAPAVVAAVAPVQNLPQALPLELGKPHRFLVERTRLSTAAGALHAVLELWGYRAEIGEEIEPNLFASATRDASSLNVFATRTPFEQIRNLNLPAVLEIEPIPGEVRYAALLRLGSDGLAHLGVGDVVLQISAHELRRLSTGRVFFVWSNFESVPALSSGMKGSAVRWLQARLADLGYLERGDPSGQFDDHTTAAIRRFQGAHALEDTGEVGAETLIALYQALHYGAPRLFAAEELS